MTPVTYIVESLQEAVEIVQLTQAYTTMLIEMEQQPTLLENAARFLGALSVQLKHTDNPLAIPDLEKRVGLAVALWMLQQANVRKQLGLNDPEKLKRVLASIGDPSQGEAYNHLLNNLDTVKSDNGETGAAIRDKLINKMSDSQEQVQNMTRFIDKLRLSFERIEGELAARTNASQSSSGAEFQAA